LTAPETNRLIPLSFTGDKQRLVCRSVESVTLHILDLGMIRTQLAAMRLDLDARVFPSESDAPSTLLAIRIVGADRILAR
jgi:hypothetical protein